MQEESRTWGSQDTQITVEEVIVPLFKDSELESKTDTFLPLDYSERVDCAYESLKDLSKYKQIISVPTVPKSNETSVEYRMCGNELFANKSYYEAFEMYTRSIAFAENDSESLALAYGNRSAVLFARSYYKECLKVNFIENICTPEFFTNCGNIQTGLEPKKVMFSNVKGRFFKHNFRQSNLDAPGRSLCHNDIERALAYNIPERSRQNLISRKGKAEEMQEHQNPITYYYPAPSLTNVNPLIPCASDSVDIEHNQKYGRHVVASKHIKIGEVVCVEDSFVNMIHIQSKYSHCHHCLELSYNLIPCDKCTNALYCGEDCLNKAQSGYHKYECDFLPILQFPGMLFTRMTLKGLDEIQNGADVETEGFYRSDSFKVALELETNEDKRNFLNLAIPAIMACIAYHSLKSNPEFKLNYDVDPKIIKRYLYKTYMVNAFNPFSIKKIRYAYEQIHTRIVATAVYCFASLFNHSCVPNCEFFYHGTLLVVRALATIPKGEQCFFSYGANFSALEYRQRQATLKYLYHFDCDCRACENRWPLFEDLPLGKKVPLSFEEKVKRNNFSNDECNKKLLKELLTGGLRLIKAMKRMNYPAMEYRQRQVLLKDLYYFDCDCKACTKGWPVFNELPNGKNIPFAFEQKVTRNNFGNKEGNRKLLKELVTDGLRLLRAMERFEPCKNYLRVQNMLSEIYTFEGCADVQF